MTILLVEDHSDTRYAIRMWLELHGHSVLEAEDFKSALTASAAPFDVLLCDIQLPDGDGWTLLKMLRKERAFGALAISGYCSPNDVARSKAAGFLMHLPKPFHGNELNAALASISSQSKKTASTRDNQEQLKNTLSLSRLKQKRTSVQTPQA